MEAFINSLANLAILSLLTSKTTTFVLLAIISHIFSSGLNLDWHKWKS